MQAQSLDTHNIKEESNSFKQFYYMKKEINMVISSDPSGPEINLKELTSSTNQSCPPDNLSVL